ncbi:hypothetical protein HYV49_00520 [Candidatus Pacearchaeota archaeon]|nr:hypothetical protein [Candidatus Pacearchaeota archaeon]
MKKEIFILLILIPLVQSLEIESKGNYSASETLIISVKGNFLEPISKENISFYEGRTEISLLYDITKIDSTYFLYAQLKPTAKNYTLRIEQAHFLENGIEKIENIEINFSAELPVADFSVSPGFVIARDSFSLNINAFKTISVTALFGVQSAQYQLSPGQLKKVTFSISEFENETLEFLLISSASTSYKIPVKVFPPIIKNQTNITEIQDSNATNKTSNETKLIFNVILINKSLKTGESKLSFNIINPANKTIENISISSNLDFVSISPSYIEKLEPLSTKTILIDISQSEPEEYQGSISISYENQESIIPVFFSVAQEEMPLKNENVYQSCSFIGGTLCSSGQKCSGTPLESLEGNCCIGKCEEIEEESGLGRTITIISITVLLLIIGFFSYKKLRAKYNVDELKKSTSKFEEKFNPKF